MNGKLIIWIIVTVCTITVVGMLMYTFADCGVPMETPPLKWRFEATDSGMYFNEYVKGELNRKFGPVPEYKKPCDIRYSIENGDTVAIWIYGDCPGRVE